PWPPATTARGNQPHVRMVCRSGAFIRAATDILTNYLQHDAELRSVMETSAEAPAAETTQGRRLHRSIGFYGLMFVSLGSIIGSGWLLGALKAAEVAGPASLISWVLAA